MTNDRGGHFSMEPNISTVSKQVKFTLYTNRKNVFINVEIRCIYHQQIY